jgi:hypothetical protein
VKLRGGESQEPKDNEPSYCSLCADPCQSLIAIRNAVQSKKPLFKTQYCFIFQKIHSLSVTGEEFTLKEEGAIAVIKLAEAFYSELNDVVGRIEMEGFMLGILPEGSRTVLQGLESMEESVLNEGAESIDFEALMWVAALLVTQEHGSERIDVNRILMPFMSMILCFLDRAIAAESKISACCEAGKVEYEGDVFRALEYPAQNNHPVLFGNAGDPKQSICTASLYKGNVSSESIIVVLKESNISHHPIKDHIENVANLVSSQLLSKKNLNKVAWYSVSTKDGLRTCELIKFNTLNNRKLKGPEWLSINKNNFLNMMRSLEELAVNGERSVFEWY